MPQTNHISIKNHRRNHQTLKMSRTCLCHIPKKILKNHLINLWTQITNNHNPILTNLLPIRKILSLPTIQPYYHRHKVNRASSTILKNSHHQHKSPHHFKNLYHLLLKIPQFNNNPFHYCLQMKQLFHHYHLSINPYLPPYLQMMFCKFIQTNPPPL
jgi:hypothetical protein